MTSGLDRTGQTTETAPRRGRPDGEARPSTASAGTCEAPGPPIPFRCEKVVDFGEWQTIADACSWATFFHTPTWARVFARVDRATRVATLVFRFEDGTTAFFPLIERRRFAGACRSTQSTAACCYGGWVADRSLLPGHASAITEAILKKSCNLVWRVNPIDPLAPLLSGRAGVADTTEVIELQEFADDEALRRHYRHSARKQVNKGCRAGLAAWVAESWEEWAAYYRIYEERLGQWGRGATSRYPLALFRALYEERGRSIRLWVVGRDGRIVGGNLNLYQSRHCVEWHAAYDCAFFSCGVRDFLVDVIVRDARDAGYLYYDFNPSGGHEGARRFKQTFGTRTIPSDLIVVRRGIYRAEAARRLLRRIRSARGG